MASIIYDGFKNAIEMQKRIKSIQAMITGDPPPNTVQIITTDGTDGISFGATCNISVPMGVWDNRTIPLYSATTISPHIQTFPTRMDVEPGKYRPCPFCGCKELVYRDDTFEIECEACGTKAPESMWNERDRKTAADAILGIKNR